MPENWQRAGFGIYIHWPFCASKCPYCDFNSHVSDAINQDDWRRAYLSEIARYGAETSDRVVSSIYFGGGTPSLMDPVLVDAMLSEIAKAWTLANDIEITLEANPSSVEASRFAGYREAGVNRVSIGVQALNAPDLKALGRLHSLDEALRAIETARSVFDRSSFDLIYARQNQSLDAWTAELRRALSFDPSHLSLYQLTIEDGTAFGDRFARGLLRGLPDEDLGADMYEATQEICAAAGLPAYEVSNHAGLGQESRHNLIYWRGGDYLGIGPGAHGRITQESVRFATDTALTPQDWLDQAFNGQGEASRVALSDVERSQEYLMMSLRTIDGTDLENIVDNAYNHSKLKDLQGEGLIEHEEPMLRVTAKGRPLLNAILREILA